MHPAGKHSQAAVLRHQERGARAAGPRRRRRAHRQRPRVVLPGRQQRVGAQRVEQRVAGVDDAQGARAVGDALEGMAMWRRDAAYA